MKIAGANAIVTGGASGLGAATAAALASRGAQVAAFDLKDGPKVEGVRYFRCDVADEDSAKTAIAAANGAHGPPGILVNCAGIGGSVRVVGREGPMPLAAFEKIIRVNLTGTFNMIRLVGAEMSVVEPDDSGNRGIIVSTASVAAFEGQIGQAAYSASKGGIAAMTLPIAREFARFGIRVNAIAPGLFETPLLDGLTDEAKQSLGAAIPYPARLGSPDEFAQLVVAMIENDYLNGEVIRLDGALRMQPK
jgi:NAD(P)-dependent dehydrogenase (short-subunit alcohol dehydrogenase family)